MKQSFIKPVRRVLREHSSPCELSAASEEKNLDEVINAVKRWLDHPKNMRWLIIYDNYDNPKLPGHMNREAVDIRQSIPEAYHGSIIITTRSSRVEIGHRIQVGKLEDVRDSLEKFVIYIKASQGDRRCVEFPNDNTVIGEKGTVQKLMNQCACLWWLPRRRHAVPAPI